MKNRKRIASITSYWNEKKFLIPHFKMISSLDKNIILKATIPWKGYAKEFNYPTISEPIDSFKRYFPKVEIYETEHEFGAELYNQGLEILKDYDIVFRLDTDMFFTKRDWKKLIDFIQGSDYECYKLNFKKHSINYYYDFDHGVMDALEVDPLAVSPKKRYSGLLDYDSKGITIDWEDFILHHFKGWKGYGAKKEWIDGKIPSPSNSYSFNLVKESGNNGKWFKCPQEIREFFE